jgi:hypothetical protein
VEEADAAATTVWRSITWLNRNGAGQFVLNAARSRIGRGVLSGHTLRSAPAWRAQEPIMYLSEPRDSALRIVRRPAGPGLRA